MSLKSFMSAGVSEKLKLDMEKEFNDKLSDKDTIKDMILNNNPEDEKSATVVANLLDGMVYNFDDDISVSKKVIIMENVLGNLNDYVKSEMSNITQSDNLMADANIAKIRIQERAEALGFVSKIDKNREDQIANIENISTEKYRETVIDMLSGMQYKNSDSNSDNINDVNKNIEKMIETVDTLGVTLKDESIKLAEKGLDKESDEFKLGLKQIAQTVRDQAREMGFAAKERKKNVFEHVGGFFKRAGNNLVDGFKAAGYMLKEAGSQFKSGAFFAGIGTTVKGVLAGLGNAATLGGTTAINKALENSVETVVDENGNVHMAGSNLISNMFANKVAKDSNQLIEINEAIEDGDIGKANALGALSIANDVLTASTVMIPGGMVVNAGKKIAAKAAGTIAAKTAGTAIANTAGNIALNTAAQTVAKKTAGTIIKKCATNMIKGAALGVATTGVRYANTYFDVDLAKDGARDNTDKILKTFCNNGYIDENDTENMSKIKDITIAYTNYENNVSEEDYMKLLAMYRDKGEIKLSLDYFKDRYIGNEEIRALVNNETTEEANMCEDLIMTALAKKDAYEITSDECDKQVYAAQYMYANMDLVKNQDISMNQLRDIANVTAAFEYGDIDEEMFVEKYNQIVEPNIQETSLAKQVVDYEECTQSTYMMDDVYDQSIIELINEQTTSNVDIEPLAY